IGLPRSIHTDLMLTGHREDGRRVRLLILFNHFLCGLGSKNTIEQDMDETLHRLFVLYGKVSFEKKKCCESSAQHKQTESNSKRNHETKANRRRFGSFWNCVLVERGILAPHNLQMEKLVIYYDPRMLKHVNTNR
ncbi:hypothetical protein FRX31_030815, partial [Thalictrum thalictroides]